MKVDVAQGSLSELLQYRHLLFCLTWRDLRVRYKQSLMGLAWTIVLPLFMTAFFAFVFAHTYQHAKDGIELPYALYALTGLAPWAFFSSSLSNCVNVLVANRNLITKVYFPHQVFPLSCVLSAGADFLVSMFALIALISYYEVVDHFSFRLSSTMLFLPLVFLVQIALTIGCGLLLSMANLFYRDVRQLFTVGIQLLMFISCVIIPIPASTSWVGTLVRLNPLVILLETYRGCMFHYRPPDLAEMAYVAVLSLIVLLCGWFMFRRFAPRFAESV